MRNRVLTILVVWGCLLSGSLVSLKAYGAWVVKRQPQVGRFRIHIVEQRGTDKW